MQVATILRELGGIASTATLRGNGVSEDRAERAVARGDIRRLRRGWYAIGSAPETAIRAVRAGGVVSCVSALSAMGAWTMPDPVLHVRVPRGSRVDPPPGVRVHRRDERILGFPVDGPDAALAIAITCVDTRAAVVVVDSILNRRLLDVADVEAVLGDSPRGRRILDLADARSESGLETIARLALRRLRLRVRSQVVIPGTGRVDLLIGDRLIVELDGRTWHDFENDRSRDRELTVRGYLVIRASYRQVMDGWPQVENQILQLVRRHEHLWRASHRVLGHSPAPLRGQR